MSLGEFARFAAEYEFPKVGIYLLAVSLTGSGHFIGIDSAASLQHMIKIVHYYHPIRLYGNRLKISENPCKIGVKNAVPPKN